MEPETLPAQHGYSETVVEIGLEGVALRQLVDFLEAIETSDVMAQIGSLYIRKDAQDATRLTSTLQIHCPRIDSDGGPPLRRKASVLPSSGIGVASH